MSRKDTIPVNLASLPRDNPMVWKDVEPATGVFLDAADPLDLLGVPAMQLAMRPKLPDDFEPGPELRAWFKQLAANLERAAGGDSGIAPLDTAGFDADGNQMIDEVLGEGEVSGELRFDGVHWTIPKSLPFRRRCGPLRVVFVQPRFHCQRILRTS
jgi:hypothetical protein